MGDGGMGPSQKTAFALHACEGATSPEAAGRMPCDHVPRVFPSFLARASNEFPASSSSTSEQS
jgi:hypothetical protein